MTSPEKTGRRAVLTAGMGAVGAGVLAACGSSSGSGAAATSAAADSASAAAPSTVAAPSTPAAPATTSAVATATPTTGAPATSAPPATSAGATTTAAATKAASGFTVPKSKIPVGSGAYFADAAAVVTQPTAGEFKAFTSVCTHQGCPVTMFSGAKMICPCHGSEYSIKDGSVLQGPAPSPLAAKKITVEGSSVVIAKT